MKCPNCGGNLSRSGNGYQCDCCGRIVADSDCSRPQGGQFGGSGRFPPPKREKSIMPCPSCHSKNTYIENGHLFVCDECGYVQGDKI